MTSGWSPSTVEEEGMEGRIVDGDETEGDFSARADIPVGTGDGERREGTREEGRGGGREGMREGGKGIYSRRHAL